jgi:hypothetical protein
MTLSKWLIPGLPLVSRCQAISSVHKTVHYVESYHTSIFSEPDVKSASDAIRGLGNLRRIFTYSQNLLRFSIISMILCLISLSNMVVAFFRLDKASTTQESVIFLSFFIFCLVHTYPYERYLFAFFRLPLFEG